MEETKAINKGKSTLPTNRTGMRPFEKSLKGILEDPRIKLEQPARDRTKKKKQEIFAENRNKPKEEQNVKALSPKQDNSIFNIIKNTEIAFIKERINNLWNKAKEKLLSCSRKEPHDSSEIEKHITTINNTMEIWDPEIAGYKAICEKPYLGIPTGLVLTLDMILLKLSEGSEDSRQNNELEFEFKNNSYDKGVDYTIYQRSIDQLLEQVKSIANISSKPTRARVKEDKNHTNYTISKAVLYDKFKANKGRVVTMVGDSIKTYEVSISNKNKLKVFYIKYENKLIQLRRIIEKLNAEGLVYGFRNIVNTLRLRNKNRKDRRQSNPDEQLTTSQTTKSLNSQPHNQKQ